MIYIKLNDYGIPEHWQTGNNEYLISLGYIQAVGLDNPIDEYYYSNGSWIWAGPKPNSHFKINPITKDWYDPRDIKQIQISKWEEVKSDRLAIINSPIPYNNNMYDGDASALLRISMYANQARYSDPFEINFTDYYNNQFILNSNDFIELENIKFNQIKHVHNKSVLIRSKIFDADTINKINKIKWCKDTLELLE